MHMHTQSGEYYEENKCNKIRKWGATHESVIRGNRETIEEPTL